MDNKEEKVYNFNQDKTILRDFLAVDRTLLANIRIVIGRLAINNIEE